MSGDVIEETYLFEDKIVVVNYEGDPEDAYLTQQLLRAANSDGLIQKIGEVPNLDQTVAFAEMGIPVINADVWKTAGLFDTTIVGPEDRAPFSTALGALRADRDAATAAATIAADNKRFNDAISAFDQEVLLQNRKFEDEARRLSDIAAQTRSQYDIQAAQRARATAERNMTEQAANFGLQMEAFGNTQGDFFRDTSTGADPSRAMRSAFVGNQSPLAQYAKRVQDLATASDQQKLTNQQKFIAQQNAQARARIQDQIDEAWELELERQRLEELRMLAAAEVGQSTGAQRATTDQRNKAVQIKLDGGDWEEYMASLNLNTVSTDIVAGSSAVDTASDNAAGASGTPAGAGGTPGGTPGGEDDTGAGNSNYGWGGIKMSPLSTPI